MIDFSSIKVGLNIPLFWVIFWENNSRSYNGIRGYELVLLHFKLYYRVSCDVFQSHWFPGSLLMFTLQHKVSFSLHCMDIIHPLL